MVFGFPIEPVKQDEHFQVEGHSMDCCAVLLPKKIEIDHMCTIGTSNCVTWNEFRNLTLPHKNCGSFPSN